MQTSHAPGDPRQSSACDDAIDPASNRLGPFGGSVPRAAPEGHADGTRVAFTAAGVLR